MHVVVVGASGNVGTALARRLAVEGDVELTGVARRVPPRGAVPISEWRARDIGRDDLTEVFRGADAVVHLAWQIQPSHDLDRLTLTNVTGSRRVFDAVVRAGVPNLVYASSVGTYARGPKNGRVDESWPTDGIASSFYGRHKAEVERLLDRFEADYPTVRTVRLRPGLVFSREAASEIRRLFLGPFFPRPLARLVPFVPRLPRLVFQCVHSADVADAYARAILGDARGAFNVAAEPPLDANALARLLDARVLPLPAGLARAAVGATWRLRVQPTPSGWLDLALGVPLMDCQRARRELGWHPERSSEDALLELIDGLRHGTGAATPPLEPDERLVPVTRR